MASIEEELERARDAQIEELSSFLRIPSISTLSSQQTEIRHAAAWLVEKIKRAGFTDVEALETGGHPVVYASFHASDDAPTILMYGHYDVQPVDPLELWTTPPFEPSIRDHQLYARGASDDKGPVFLHILALEALIRRKELHVNVKLCIEGEEECGSTHLPAFLEKNAERLRADVLLISDTTMVGPLQPGICYGLRGLCALQVDVKTANSDLHSGLYGGAVPNALHAIVELLASLHRADGSVAVEGFYDEVVSLTSDERAALAELPHDDEAYRKALGLTALYGEEGYTTIERSTARPTLEINGLYGGFQGEGTKTVIPHAAHAKITCRLVNQQSPDVIQEKVKAHLLAHAPSGAKLTVTLQDTGNPYLGSFDSPAVELAKRSYEHAYGVQPHMTRMGGSIPIIEVFHRVLNLPVVLMGFSLMTENFHAPNEHFSLENFDRGIRALVHFYREAATQLK